MSWLSRSPDQELQKLLERVVEEREALDQWLQLVSAAGERLEAQRAQTDAIEARVGGIAGKVTDLEEINRRVDQVLSRIDRMERKQGEADEQSEVIARRVRDAETTTASMTRSLDQAHVLKAELEAQTGAEGPVTQMRKEGGALREQFLQFQHDVLQVRDTLASLQQVRDAALGDIAGMRAEVLRLKDTTGETELRLEDMGRVVRDVQKVDELSTRTRRDMEALSALADRVTQKTTAVEAQRELVERVGAQSTRLTELAWDLDARIKRMDERGREWKKAERKADEIREMLGKIEGEVTRADGLWREAAGTTQQAGEQLEATRRRLDEAVARLGAERGDVETLTRRLADLRNDIGEVEQRQVGLAQADQRAREAQGRADEVSIRVETLLAEFTRLENLGERVLAADNVVERVARDAQLLDGRLSALAARAPELEQLRGEVDRLSAAHGAVEDATGRLTGARGELDRAVETVGAARADAAVLRARLDGLEQQAAALEPLGPELTRTTRLAERIIGQLDATQRREEFVQGLDRRLDALGALSADVAERQRRFEEGRAAIDDAERRLAGLVDRLRDVDQRFATAGERAQAADAVADRLVQVEHGVTSATDQMASLARDVEVTRRKHAEVESLAERADEMLRTITEREAALSGAIKQLEQATYLRADAVKAVGDVGDRVRQLETAVRSADAEAGRLTHFEEKLTELARAEERLGVLVGEWRSREDTMAAFRTDIERMRASTEQTRSEIASIADAQDSVEATRRRLDDLLERASESEQLATRLDERVARLSKVESELARVDGLLGDARASLETLHGERATLEFLVEKAGKLAVESRQAEALITALKEERDRVQRVAEGLRELRDERAG